MRSIGWKLRSKHRLLEVSLGGRWYLGFTVALGVAAVYSGNNVIYLLESLLLSSLLVSGVLSEITISRVKVTREIGNIHAGGISSDVFIVENCGKLPLYCIELGEVVHERREFTAFLLALPGRSKIRVRSKQTIPERGRHRWDGIAVATSFPFGFARKVRLIDEPGSRIVWPKAVDPGRSRNHELQSKRGEMDIVVGEVVPVEPWEDATRVHWPISSRAGEMMARPHRPVEAQEEIWLDLRTPGPEMERAISRAAGALLKRANSLVLVQKGERQMYRGSSRSLDALALLPKDTYEVEH